MAHGSNSCWLWMLSSFKVWLLYLAFLVPSDLGILFFFCFCYSFFFFFFLTLDYIDHVVQANFLQKKGTKKENLWKIHSNCSVQ